MTIAAIIGNGCSRREFDLMRFHQASIPVWGCNALYREYDAVTRPIPDKLVMVDDGIILEVQRSQFPADRVVIPIEDHRWEPAAANPNRPRMNAGMAAMSEAITRGCTALLCLGFDFLMLKAECAVSNLYDGTPNYGPETRANHADTPNRLRYLNWFLHAHPTVKFQFVFPVNTTVATLFTTNAAFMTYEQLDAHLREQVVLYSSLIAR
jgi:hypothetical protein